MAALHLKKDARPGLPRPLSMPHDPVEPLSPRLDESLLQSVISGADHSLVYVKGNRPCPSPSFTWGGSRRGVLHNLGPRTDLHNVTFLQSLEPQTFEPQMPTVNVWRLYRAPSPFVHTLLVALQARRTRMPTYA